MNITFKDLKGDFTYIVTDIQYGNYKDEITTFVRGGYDYGEGIVRKMPTKLFKCKRTGRPTIRLSGKKLYAVCIEDDRAFSEILVKAPLK